MPSLNFTSFPDLSGNTLPGFRSSLASITRLTPDQESIERYISGLVEPGLDSVFSHRFGL